MASILGGDEAGVAARAQELEARLDEATPRNKKKLEPELQALKDRLDAAKKAAAKFDRKIARQQARIDTGTAALARIGREQPKAVIDRPVDVRGLVTPKEDMPSGSPPPRTADRLQDEQALELAEQAQEEALAAVTGKA